MSISFTPSQVLAIAYVIEHKTASYADHNYPSLFSDELWSHIVLAERAISRFNREFSGYIILKSRKANGDDVSLDGLLASVRMYKGLLNETLIPIIAEMQGWGR